MLKRKLWTDLETRSRVDLKKQGVYKYVACPDHRILIASWALDDGPVKSVILKGHTLPAKYADLLDDDRVQIVAHNAGFERLNLNRLRSRFGMPPLPIERFYCVATQARAMALPGALDNLARAFNPRQRKDARGAFLIRALTIPQKDGTFNDDPVLMEEFRRYCEQDTVSMRAISKELIPLTDEALALYHANERINDRGLPIDVEMCRLATAYAEREVADATKRVKHFSGGELTSPRGTKLSEWVYIRLTDEQKTLMQTVVNNGGDAIKRGAAMTGNGGLDTCEQVDEEEDEEGISLAADRRAALVMLGEGAFAPEVWGVLKANDDVAMASVAKFKAMEQRAGEDDRVRGAYITNGAVQTGRFTAHGAQVHNFFRKVLQNVEEALEALRAGVPLPGGGKSLRGLLRPAIKPSKGRVLVCGDWSAVEARGLPWLAEAEEYLKVFSDPTRDIYVEQSHASGLGGERQPGKVVVLSLGYGGSIGALAKMAKNYGVTIAKPLGVVKRWRKANQWAVDWWDALDTCARRAMRNPGKPFKAGRVSLVFDGWSLTMILPSGRTIYYPAAAFNDDGDIEYLKASWKPKADAVRWPRQRLWHGILAENATQAICADLLRHTLLKCADLNVIGHVHDEVIVECPAKDGAKVAKALQRAMLSLPAWAKGFPLAVEVEVSERYK